MDWWLGDRVYEESDDYYEGARILICLDVTEERKSGGSSSRPKSDTLACDMQAAYDATSSLTGCGDWSRIADACTCVQGNSHRVQGHSQTTTAAILEVSNHDAFIEGEVHIIL